MAVSTLACSGASKDWWRARQRAWRATSVPSHVAVTAERLTRTSMRRPTNRGLTE